MCNVHCQCSQRRILYISYVTIELLRPDLNHFLLVNFNEHCHLAGKNHVQTICHPEPGSSRRGRKVLSASVGIFSRGPTNSENFRFQTAFSRMASSNNHAKVTSLLQPSATSPACLFQSTLQLQFWSFDYPCHVLFLHSFIVKFPLLHLHASLG